MINSQPSATRVLIPSLKLLPVADHPQTFALGGCEVEIDLHTQSMEQYSHPHLMSVSVQGIPETRDDTHSHAKRKLKSYRNIRHLLIPPS